MTQCGSLESHVYTIILHLLLLLGCHTLHAVITLTDDRYRHFCIFLYSSRATEEEVKLGANWWKRGWTECWRDTGWWLWHAEYKCLLQSLCYCN